MNTPDHELTGTESCVTEAIRSAMQKRQAEIDGTQESEIDRLRRENQQLTQMNARLIVEVFDKSEALGSALSQHEALAAKYNALIASTRPKPRVIDTSLMH